MSVCACVGMYCVCACVGMYCECGCVCRDVLSVCVCVCVCMCVGMYHEFVQGCIMSVCARV